MPVHVDQHAVLDTVRQLLEDAGRHYLFETVDQSIVEVRIAAFMLEHERNLTFRVLYGSVSHGPETNPITRPA